MLVQEAIFKLMENRTSLVIAHRLSTIKRADLIIVIQGGRIAESGTHEELMDKQGVYKQLVEMQNFS
jgi:subfamily B ATP-binding cassette protein MsbA